MDGFNNLCRFTSVLDGIGCIVMTHLDFLFLEAWAQRVECHYDHVKVKDTNSGHLLYPFFVHKIYKKEKRKKNLCSQWGGY